MDDSFLGSKFMTLEYLPQFSGYSLLNKKRQQVVTAVVSS